MNVLFLSSEVAPWSKTGGLADVASALPQALAGRGHRVTVVSPHYASLDRSRFPTGRTGARARVEVGEGRPVVFEVFEAARGRVRWLFLDDPALFGRPGLYGEKGVDYADNGLRFGAFSVGALAAVRALGEHPTIVHANDWQTAPAVLLAAMAGRPRAHTVFTIHNLAFQGLFPRGVLRQLGWPESLFDWRSLEFYGSVSFLKAGLLHADALTTVSPTYAKEICTPEHGCGLDGVLRARRGRLRGILNGIDSFEWDPKHDPALPHHYDSRSLRGKARCKSALQRELGLEETDAAPLAVSVGRLTHQKGTDLLLDAVDDGFLQRAQLAWLGTGEAGLEERVRQLAADHPGRVAAVVGFDEALAHRFEAGGDFFVMPSRFEPCGLNQMYSLRYGTPPIVRATGGLCDTVRDAGPDLAAGNGFVFGPAEPTALRAALERAVAAFGRPAALEELRLRGMAEDCTWEASAAQYEDLYLELESSRGR
ncbi:MAG TPA: glycogen synthase GlgA [Myxococcales bacterium]|nr:glycogen synthase GlgA [Myxococcales bacterium]